MVITTTCGAGRAMENFECALSNRRVMAAIVRDRGGHVTGGREATRVSELLAGRRDLAVAGLLEELLGLAGVLRHALAVLVEHAEAEAAELRPRVARQAEVLRGSRVIALEREGEAD